MDDRWAVEYRTRTGKWERYNSYPTRAEADAKVRASRQERWPRWYQFRVRELVAKVSKRKAV